MAGGSGGTESQAAVTSGGWRGMNGTQRRIAIGCAAGFALILVLVMASNAESTRSDLAVNGVHIPAHLVWSWEWSSILAWISVMPLIWIGVAKLRPPRVTWPVAVFLLAIGSVAASAWHIGVMVAIRHLYYEAAGAGPYDFFAIGDDRLVYEYRKDVIAYLQFVAIAAAVQWIIQRAATLPAPGPQRTPMLAVSDGSVRHSVPIAEIEQVSAAGNYVEIAWGQRTLLHRATLTAIETELGTAFARVHRGALVNRDAIRAVAVDKSGDFTVSLASGATVRGSRRFRAAVDADPS